MSSSYDPADRFEHERLGFLLGAHERATAPPCILLIAFKTSKCGIPSPAAIAFAVAYVVFPRKRSISSVITSSNQKRNGRHRWRPQTATDLGKLDQRVAQTVFIVAVEQIP